LEDGGFTGGDKSGFVTTGTTLPFGGRRRAASQHDPHHGRLDDPVRSRHSIRGIQEEIRTDHYPDIRPSKVATGTPAASRVYGDGHAKWNKWGSTRARDWSIQADE
jgi:hypothetical protein